VKKLPNNFKPAVPERPQRNVSFKSTNMISTLHLESLYDGTTPIQYSCLFRAFFLRGFIEHFREANQIKIMILPLLLPLMARLILQLSENWLAKRG
jgi:hypothetical protein